MQPMAEFIESHTTTVPLRDGTHMRIRPIIPEDKDRLIEGFERMSSESKFRYPIQCPNQFTIAPWIGPMK